MKRQVILAAMCAAIGGAAMAQTQVPDSTQAKELHEVVVEGRTQRVIDEGVEYIPSKKVKKGAIDATHLLMMMNIPELSLTPGSTSVKTYTGDDVAMFIDQRPADANDLEGLRPEDVLRVEVLEYPQDIRYGGAPHVINFVMRKYEWGGYTKLTAKGVLVGAQRADGILYSKFVRRNWTFDASVNGGIAYNDKARGHGEETFRDISVGDRHFGEIARITDTDNSVSKNNSQNVSFRAMYRTKTSEITHTLSYGRRGNPLTRQHEAVDFSEDIFDASSAFSRESGQTLSPSARGYYYFSMDKGNSVVARWDFTYGSTRRLSSYQLGGLDPIINNNREETYAPNVMLRHEKKFARNNTFRTTLYTYNTIYRTHYQGSYDGLQKLLSSENMLFLEYMQRWQSGLSLYSRVGVSYVIGRVNGVNTLEQWNPRLGFQLNYKISDRHRASAEGWWGNNHPDPSSANTAIVQSDELMWHQGNPDLRNTTFCSGKASYTYIPNNRLSLSATASYDGFLSKPALDYFSRPGYDGLIRREINSGDCHIFSGYLSATLRLPGNALSLRASGNAERIITTGIDHQTLTTVSAEVSASYSLDNLSFYLYYETPGRNFDAFAGVRYRNRSTYGASVNYSARNFKASLQFLNWFDSNRLYADYDSPRYSTRSWSWNSQYARTLRVVLSYTLPYGKKVKQNNEIEASDNINSAILK